MAKTLNKHLMDKRHFNQYVNPEALSATAQLPESKPHLKPATLAVLVQSAALFTVLALSWTVQLVAAAYLDTNLTFSMLALVLMQASLAAIFSSLAGMASWWRWIHSGFPIAIWGMSNWHIPNEFYLAGFMVCLGLFWTTFRSQVPFFPSRPVVWRQVAKLMPKDKPVRLIDIGSGLGDMPMYIAKDRPDCRIEGIEIAPLPWLVSVLRAKIKRSKAVLKLGDYRALDFANYDVVFAYLSPAVMLALWQKAHQEMKPGSLLISLEFEIQGISPDIRIAGIGHSPALYVWRFP